MRIAVGLLAIFAIGAIGFMGQLGEQPGVVEALDVERYMGLWYAVASIPTTFERACVQGTTAEYHLLPNGQVEVTNTCYRADGSPLRIVGRAWIPDPSAPAKLKVGSTKPIRPTKMRSGIYPRKAKTARWPANVSRQSARNCSPNSRLSLLRFFLWLPPR